jgi:nicotinate-nucleotide--dimethylbenzimidazole phosphoribosyltransferase
MTSEQALQAVDIGIRVAADLCTAGIGLIGVGEMGIGNTTAASALTAVFTGEPVERVTGRGTGIDDAVWNRKVQVIEKALAVNRPRRDQPLDAVAKVGGFELAGLAGVMLGAAARKVPIVLDGFITGAAALVAVALCPDIRDYLIASHQSVEPGHRRILEHLELRPLFNLDLRLGEGTGAVLAMHLVEAAIRIVREMATFTSAGVSSRGEG